MTTVGYTRSTARHRMLPVYLLIDCSGSMLGDPITAVKEGLEMIKKNLHGDPRARETVMISIIKFAEFAEQEEMVSVKDFSPPELEADGRTALGAALHVLIESIENDLRLNDPTAGVKGDYRPLVFLLTDGQPTDEYQEELERLTNLRGSRKPACIVALGCGNEVNETLLAEITPDWYLMPDMMAAGDGIKKFLKYVSDTVLARSKLAVPDGATPLERLEGEEFISSPSA